MNSETDSELLEEIVTRGDDGRRTGNLWDDLRREGTRTPRDPRERMKKGDLEQCSYMSVTTRSRDDQDLRRPDSISGPKESDQKLRNPEVSS